MTWIKFDTGKFGEALQKCASKADGGDLPCDDCPLFDDVTIREQGVVGIGFTMSPCLMSFALAKAIENRLNEGEGLD